jgi:hypothetical protein
MMTNMRFAVNFLQLKDEEEEGGIGGRDVHKRNLNHP